MNRTASTSPHTIPSNRIINQDCLSGMRSLPDSGIDMVVTSPPYWRLRDYGPDTKSVWGGDPSCTHEWVNERAGKTTVQGFDDGSQSRVCANCGAWYGQLGLEADIQAYSAHLIEIFDEVYRVLKPTGSCWVNIGDSYFSAKGSCRNPGGNIGSIESRRKGKHVYPLHRGNRSDNPLIKPKSLTLIPFHFCIAMQAHGWMLRNTIIWHKQSCMPSSVKDRFTVDFEYLFFFVKQRTYHFEQQFEPYRSTPHGAHPIGGIKYPGAVPNRTYSGNAYTRPQGSQAHGRNKRTVWTINPKPFPDVHFAVFPDTLIETPIRAGCPEDGIVLDPFMGSGTTALAAVKLNRRYLGFEIKDEYCEMAEKRIQERRARNQSSVKAESSSIPVEMSCLASSNEGV